MLDLSSYCLVTGTVLVALSLLSNVAVVALHHQTVPVRTPALAHATTGAAPAQQRHAHRQAAQRQADSWHGMAWYASLLGYLALAFLTASLGLRMAVTGHAPFANQYEFAVSFGWGMVLAYCAFEYRYHMRVLSLTVLPVALAMLVYAGTVTSDAAPLVPALQNHLLLTLHVITAVVSYGAAGVAFGAAVLYLLRPKLHWASLPKQEVLDQVGYRAVVISFPLMTIMIILGAIWAQIAWGKYWSWDPKETAALVSWLIYGAYLHARVVADWRGKRAALLLIIGFAAVMLTFFGNLFFGGMHSYA